MNISEMVNMGGYGVYVWSAYIITLTVFGMNLFFAFRERRKIMAEIQITTNHPFSKGGTSCEKRGAPLEISTFAKKGQPLEIPPFEKGGRGGIS